MPIAAVLKTCVPPQSSRETPSTSITRTQFPYFSPNRAIAPSCSASMRDISKRPYQVALLDPLVDAVPDVLELLATERGAVGEVEAQLVGAHRRPCLADVGAEALAERGVQQMGRGVVAHRREAETWSTSASTRAPARAPRSAVELDRLVVPIR